MSDRLILNELLEQSQDSQIDIVVIRETLALLLSRLVASGVVDAAFLEDLTVCADGVDYGRGSTIAKADVSPDMRVELDELQTATRSRRASFFELVGRLVNMYRR